MKGTRLRLHAMELKARIAQTQPMEPLFILCHASEDNSTDAPLSTTEMNALRTARAATVHAGGHRPASAWSSIRGSSHLSRTDITARSSVLPRFYRLHYAYIFICGDTRLMRHPRDRRLFGLPYNKRFLGLPYRIILPD